MAPVVADSSALIALQRIGRLELLHGLFGEIAVPPAVAREVERGGLELPPWVQVRSLQETPARGLPSRKLGEGEREAIDLAFELGGAQVILDDLSARSVGRERGLEVVGTAAVLYLAKRRGLIEAVRPSLDALLADGFRLSPAVYSAILEAAGEDESR